MTTGWLLSSGVGQLPGVKYDGIGQLADELKAMGYAVMLNRIPRARIRGMQRSIEQSADWYCQFDEVRMAGHSRGVQWLIDVARQSGLPVAGLYSADGWSPNGVLSIPANVQYLAAWYQHEHKPSGSRIHLEGSTLFDDLGPVTGVKHREMPCLPAFRKAVLSAATKGIAR